VEEDPLGETLRAIEGIPKDKVFVDGYAAFQRDMVYGDKSDFGTAMQSLNALGDQLRKLWAAMSAAPFTRPTILAAVAFLARLTQAAFNHLVLRLGLESEIPSDTSLSISKKADLLGRIVVQPPDAFVETVEGRLCLPNRDAGFGGV
jgi:hypothetical protein